MSDTFSRQGHGTPLAADAPRQLVTTRLFRWTRNPIMAAELCVIWAGAFYRASVAATPYAVAITLLAPVLVVQIEEPELRERFGHSYTNCYRDVAGWLPKFGRRAGSRGG